MSADWEVERLKRKAREHERRKSGLRWSFMGLVYYFVFSAIPGPAWLAWESHPVPVVVTFLAFMFGFGYFGMWFWQWQKPEGNALSADEIGGSADE